MKGWKDDRIGSAAAGTNPMVMMEMDSGYAVFGDTQFLPGYSVLLPKHRIRQLNDLSVYDRVNFLRDMTLLGDAVAKACAPVLRLNYDILGNSDAFLHAHIFPRYAWEPAERSSKPVWLYPQEVWTNERYDAGRECYRSVREGIERNLKCLVTGSAVV
ncbi:HIT family protein [Bifidobacterium bombi]|uniref:Histidine triad (HIT) protein n=1 Tax=Bifidobacterium bombi DSM 19703 TaxID=1341695 RepID=A0A080N663_9BIFI|nr:DeoR family transcriptional regulator [Bifidobacterium bombi]KFF31299.1 histidine triad (HIT) protein [Bifidobacterium bombi DSM 19703]